MNRLIEPILEAHSYDSKLEERYAQYLELCKHASNDPLLDWFYHGLKFRVGNGSWYTPDFGLIYRNYIEFDETKGYHRNIRESLAKIKSAALIYPWWRWAIVTSPKGKGWQKEYL